MKWLLEVTSGALSHSSLTEFKGQAQAKLSFPVDVSVHPYWHSLKMSCHNT